MPQGPTSRGCEACRSQKKRCDLTIPICMRCQRLRIEYIGCGQRRYRFSAAKTESLAPRQFRVPFSGSSIPSNETTSLQQAIVARLETSDDVRYAMTYRWGVVLIDLPKRLGCNQALDAAVLALLARHAETSLRQDQSNSQAPAVREYYRAVSVLRTSLSEDCQYPSSETLCAVMLLTFCQARFDDQFTFFLSPHGLGIVQLLRLRNFPCGSNDFETRVLAYMYATTVLQSFANPSVDLSTAEYRKCEGFFANAGMPACNTQHWVLMVQVSELMKQARGAIAYRSSLQAITNWAKELHSSIQSVLAVIRDELKISKDMYRYSYMIHAVYQRTLGVALATLAILLCAQKTMSPMDLTLESVAAEICEEVLLICDHARAYRPVGAVWTVHPLICVWCATQDHTLRQKVEDALLDYQRDAMGPQAIVQIHQLRRLEKQFYLAT